MIQFYQHIFQVGWFNHQQAVISLTWVKYLGGQGRDEDDGGSHG